MRTACIIALMAAAIAPVPALAADHQHADHGAMAAPAQGAAMVDAQVKKVDKAAGKVTLAHGPLTNLAMPAMTMVFRVKDPAWLEKMKDGDKIRFVADKVNGVFTVVQFEPMK